METPKYGTCDEEPTIVRDEKASAIEITCGCGTMRYSPDEDGTADERPIKELEADALSLWTFAHDRAVKSRQ